MVIADADLEEALVELRRARGGDGDDDRAPRPESTLSVREMQQRLRSGQTIEEVARVAGVAEEWIARFAVPIQAEQSLVINRALDLVVNKQRVGPSSQSLGTSVWWNLQDRGAKLSEEEWSAGWTAFLVRDQVWVVQFAYTFRKKNQVAEWEVDLRPGTLHSRNRLGTDLGYVEPGRRRRPGPPRPIPGGLVSRPAPPTEPVSPAVDASTATTARPSAKPRPSATKRSAPRPAATKKTSAKKIAAKKKAPAKRVAAKKTSAKKAAAKKAPAKKVAAKRRPARPAPAKRGAARRAPARKSAAKRPAKKTRPAAAAILTPSGAVTPVLHESAPRAIEQRSAPRPTPLIAGAARAGGVRAEAPMITPAPAPSVARRRPVGDDGIPVRRREPLRAR